MRPLSLSALLTFALAIGTGSANAQSFPSRTISIAVGFAAGGPTDVPARMIAQKLSTSLNTTVLVENRLGASGRVAAHYVLSRPADGYTLLLCTHFEAINAVLYKVPPYKIDDLVPVSQISSYYYGFAVSNTIPVDNFEQFVSYAKAHPTDLNHALSSSQEILANQFEKQTGISMTRVPFNNTPQVLQEMIAGRVHFFANPISGMIPQYKAKQLKLIAVSGPERMKEAPDVPTLKEKGIENIYAAGWLGICAAPGTPKPIVELLNKHIRDAVASPEYRTLVENTGSTAVSSTPEEFGTIIRQTAEQVAPTIAEFNMIKSD